MMKWFKSFILMIQFFTRIPIPMEIDVNNKSIKRGLVFLPVIGSIVGVFGALPFVIFHYIGMDAIGVIFALLFMTMLTGMLHIDGIADTWDGLLSSRTRERMLDIMRDSRIGTNGVVAIIFDYGIKIVVILFILSEFGWVYTLYGIILMPIAGRLGIITVAAVSEYARSDNGLGRMFIEGAGIREWIICFVLSIAAAFLMGGFSALTAIILILAAALISKKWMTNTLGGMTGDTLGAVNEICEIFFILLLPISDKLLMWLF